MNKKYSGYVLGGIALLLIIWMAVTYNGLVKKDEKVSLQWNEVQNAYQRRLDLVPNLVSTVKGGANFEQTTLREITEARSRAASLNVNGGAIDSETYNNVNNAQNDLAAATNRLIAAVEKYPDIKGTKAFTGLQTQLERTELRIKIARKDFNAAVADYNKKVKSFPGNLVAGITGFPAKEGFTSDAGADKSVDIKF